MFLLGAGYLVLTEAHPCQKTYPVLVRKNKMDLMAKLLALEQAKRTTKETAETIKVGLKLFRTLFKPGSFAWEHNLHNFIHDL